jgi:hypothetical protein
MNHLTEKYYIDEIETPAGKIRTVKTELKFGDYLGAWRVRWGYGRMDYRVHSGLYAVGHPDEESQVLVTANYKLTFDTLRKELTGLNLWILVLDTKGVNVWCAAGKGTFGTKEIIRSVLKSRLFDIVKHRKLILPQLGAPGVTAHEVTKSTGFSVMYGPVRASDIREYLASGMKKTDEMAKVKFTFWDRLVLVPLEVVGAWKIALIMSSFALLAGILTYGIGVRALFYPIIIFAGLFSGTVLSPLLLPLIPVKSFAFKGGIIGIAVSVLISLIFSVSPFIAVPLGVIASAISAYAALQFTGASTYTSENGVRYEIKYAMPILRISGVLGIVTAICGIVVSIIKRGGIS